MIAIVTGASSGMGREFVKKLDAYEALDEIWVIARRRERLEELKSEVKTPLKTVCLDLTEKESIENYSLMLASEKPEVGFLVNCSGYGKFGHSDVVSLEDTNGMIDLNVKALTDITLITLPYIQKGGHIIELCSLSFSRGLNAELRGRDIHVTAVCPGWVQTEFFARAETSQKDAVTYFNHMYQAKDVIDTAYRDAKKNKDVSIHGFPVKFQVFLVKLLPHSLVMKIWLKQQKHR